LIYQEGGAAPGSHSFSTAYVLAPNGLIPAKYPGMTHITMNREIPEDLIPTDTMAALQSERGVAGYRAKIYKTLLDITSESDYTKRPLVDRSGRWLVKMHRA
jgi:hypothetical protein